VVVDFEAQELGTHPVMRTRDVAEAEALVSQVYVPHRLDSDAGLDARMNVAQGIGITLGWLRYGAESRLSVPPMVDAYHLNLTLTGTTAVRQNGASVRTTGGDSGALLSPTETATVHWSPDAAQFAIKLDRRSLEAQLSALLHDAVTRRLRFSLRVDLRTSPGAALLAATRFLAGQWQLGGPAEELALRQLESYLLTTVLLGVPNTYSTRLSATAGPVRRHALDEAVEYIEAHPERVLGIAELAAVAGTSAAELGAAFRAELGTTPGAYVREVRLARARADLMADGGACTVAEVARRWGFRDVARFTSAYAARYGEPPREAATAQT
jgi:AraC-like DNA-binding protein